ncbi:CPBP family intramembrane metalloprotease [Prolixibacteraceae bacterium JC049]|nr:CPBP family intramembrane metalloprotease [Prolixibacteraceae bacterium JC049]
MIRMKKREKNTEKYWYYPRILQGVHLVVLYIFMQAIIDFPLALYDYFNGTEWLGFPPLRVAVHAGTTLFILIYGYIKTYQPFLKVFPIRLFNPLVILSFIILLSGAHYYIGFANEWLQHKIPPPPWFWELISGIFENDYGFWGVALKVAVIAPIIEEAIFRGIIMHGFMRNYSKFTAVVLSALMFALFHLNPWQFPATFFLGLLLGWLMVRTKNLMICIIGHAINNLLVLVSIEYWKELGDFAVFNMPKQDSIQLAGLLISLGVVTLLLFTRPKTLET